VHSPNYELILKLRSEVLLGMVTPSVKNSWCHSYFGQKLVNIAPFLDQKACV